MVSVFQIARSPDHPMIRFLKKGISGGVNALLSWLQYEFQAPCGSQPNGTQGERPNEF
jgi:hypothetical protein